MAPPDQPALACPWLPHEQRSLWRCAIGAHSLDNPGEEAQALPHLSLKTIEIVADGHSEGQQFLERLPRFLKMYNDASRAETNARGQVFKFLRENFDRGLDQEWGVFEALLVQAVQD